MSESRKHVEALIKKAAGHHSADEAMKFAQAALNSANALCGLERWKRESGDT